MSNRSDTNSYEPARIRPRVQSLRDSAVRPPHGCVLLTNVDGFRFEKVEGGGRDGEGRAVEVVVGGRGGVVKTVRFVSAVWWERAERGRRVPRRRPGRCSARQSTPRITRRKAWEGCGLQVPACNAASSRSRGNGRSRPKSVTVR